MTCRDTEVHTSCPIQSEEILNKEKDDIQEGGIWTF